MPIPSVTIDRWTDVSNGAGTRLLGQCTVNTVMFHVDAVQVRRNLGELVSVSGDHHDEALVDAIHDLCGDVPQTVTIDEHEYLLAITPFGD